MDLKKQEELEKRLVNYYSRVSLLLNEVPSLNIRSQSARSASSIGANYKEACGSESLRDFLHKCHLCLKEALETKYWLLLIQKQYPQLATRMGELLNESDEVVKIFGKIVSTSKKRLKNE